MVEIAGASDLISGGEQPQQLTRADAFARRTELLHDADFKERVEKKDPGALAELQRVHSSITKVDFTNIGNEEQVKASELLDREQRLETWRRGADIPEPVAQQIREGRSVSREEYRLAEQEKKRLLADADFRRDYFSGNRAARTRMALVSIVLGSRIAETK